MRHLFNVLIFTVLFVQSSSAFAYVFEGLNGKLHNFSAPLKTYEYYKIVVTAKCSQEQFCGGAEVYVEKNGTFTIPAITINANIANIKFDFGVYFKEWPLTITAKKTNPKCSTNQCIVDDLRSYLTDFSVVSLPSTKYNISFLSGIGFDDFMSRHLKTDFIGLHAFKTAKREDYPNDKEASWSWLPSRIFLEKFEDNASNPFATRGVITQDTVFKVNFVGKFGCSYLRNLKDPEVSYSQREGFKQFGKQVSELQLMFNDLIFNDIENGGKTTCAETSNYLSGKYLAEFLKSDPNREGYSIAGCEYDVSFICNGGILNGDMKNPRNGSLGAQRLTCPFLTDEKISFTGTCDKGNANWSFKIGGQSMNATIHDLGLVRSKIELSTVSPTDKVYFDKAELYSKKPEL